MANEWPSNDSEDWDDAIEDNLNAGHESDGSHALGTLSAFKTITFTRDMTAASGDVAYTGVGFQPRQVVFFASVASNAAGSWGVDDGTNVECIFQYSDGSMDSSSALSPNKSIYFDNGAGSDYTSAKISAIGSDGFTLTWTLHNSLSATATIIALCLK